MLKTKTPKAYAMALFLMVMMVLSSLVVVSFMASTSDIKQTRSNELKNQARMAGQDALARFYASLTSDKSFREAVIASHYDGSVWRTLSDVSSASAPTNQCDPTSSDICVKVRVGLEFFGNPAVADNMAKVNYESFEKKQTPVFQPLSAAVRVDVRSQCPAGDTDFKECPVSGAYSQRIVPSQFYEYAFYNQYSTLDPGLYQKAFPASASYTTNCADKYALRSNPDNTSSPTPRPSDGTCLEVAYQSDITTSFGDIIDGPIFTNDDYILVCNSPDFNSEVYANPAGIRDSSGSVKIWRSAGSAPYNYAGCSTSSPTWKAATPTDPGQPNGVRVPALETTMPSASEYVSNFINVISTAGEPFGVTLNSPLSRVELRPGTTGNTEYRVSTDSGSSWSSWSALPNGFLFSKGNLEVSGTYSGTVAVFAAGDLSIIGDLKRANSTSILGATAGGSLTISQLPAKDPASSNPSAVGPVDCPLTDTSCKNTAGSAIRQVDALLVSLSGSVSVPDWNTYHWDPKDAPTLKFDGIIASKYQGVFGGYNKDLGNLVSGYRKDFTFDSRLNDGASGVTAPFLPGPMTGNWTRLDLAEIPANTK